MNSAPIQSSDTDNDLLARFRLLKAENDALKGQLMNTSLINELTKVMQSSTDLEGIIKTLLLGIQDILQFDRVILFDIDIDNFCIKPRSWIGLDAFNSRDLEIPLGFEGGDITDAIFLNRHLIVENPDPENDPFSSHLTSRSYLVLPLLTKATKKCWESKSCTQASCPAYGNFNPYCWSIQGSGQLLMAASENERRRQCIKCASFKSAGVIWMDRFVNTQPITSDDITALSTVVNLAGIIIENFKALNALEKANTDLSSANNQLKVVNHDLEVAQTKINNDLRQAKLIQQGLLPQNLQSTAAFGVGARYIPADAVGGDYYDVFEITPGIHGIVVADVSGHGIASALIMSMAKVLLKTFASDVLSPQKTLERINQTFLTEIKTDNFVTLFYGIVDTTKHILSYTSAGHCPVLVINKETRALTRINADGLFLGVFPDMMLNESSQPYDHAKSRLILYTDGLTETHNAEEEMFDLPRLEAIVESTCNLPADKAVEKILEAQRIFCGNDRKPEDDITLLIIDL